MMLDTVIDTNFKVPKIRNDEICTPLLATMGTGGGNIPMIIEEEDEKGRDNKDRTD